MQFLEITNAKDIRVLYFRLLCLFLIFLFRIVFFIIILMPVFAFMGSNLLCQDDSYTFEVINRTLESIVPTLVKVIIIPFSIQYCVYMYFSI